MFAARHPAEVPKVINLAGRFRTREGTLARFGADILERLAAGKGGIPRKEAWGEWVMTEQVGSCPLCWLPWLLMLPDMRQKQSSRLTAASVSNFKTPATPCPACLCLQDFLDRVNLDMEGMARSIPPTLRMLCLHGTADKTIPYQVLAAA